jgi:small subunit ribosomal protein S9
MEEEKLIEREIISDAVAAGKGEHQGVQMHAIDDDDFESLTDSKKKIKSASKRAGMTVKAKKKTAIARGVIKKGTGKIKINKISLSGYAGGYVREFISEPLKIIKEDMKDYDIIISVSGSGFMSQAVAVRACIAKAIVRAKGKKYRELFNNFDRMLLVDDVRKVESKKPLGRKARKKWQHSKR